jgi:UDP-glucose 4-epimerase
MKVFITGGAGFIGSHLCDALVAEGKEVTILDNLSTGSEKNIAHLEGKIKVFQGDIRDQKLVESLVEKSDLVLHMAAALGVDNILENPIESISTNYHGSEIVLNAAVKYDKRIVIASTSEIYGKNPKQPLSETDDRVVGTPQKLRWTYSDAKSLEEAQAYFLFLTKNLKVTTLRLFNTVGPRQTGKYGMVLPRFINWALNNEPMIVVGSGNQTRTFCHVSDVVQAILLILDTENTLGEVFNIGGFEEISIKDLAHKVKKITKSNSVISYKPQVEFLPASYEDIPRRVPNVSKIESFTTWRAKINLDTTIKDIIKHLT